MSYNIVADLHTHTLGSSTGFSTLTENLDFAVQNALKCIAVTDYGPKFDSSKKEKLLSQQRYLPKSYKGVRIFKGVESNILDLHTGKLDLDSETLSKFDWVIASYHKISDYDEKIISNAVMDNMIKKVILNPCVMMLGHIERYAMLHDIKPIIQSAKENGKVIEINEACFNNPEQIARLKQIVSLCKETAAPICVTSNAHLSYQVGVFTNSKRLLEDLNFPATLIINSDMDVLNSYLSNFYKLRDNSLLKTKRNY